MFLEASPAGNSIRSTFRPTSFKLANKLLPVDFTDTIVRYQHIESRFVVFGNKQRYPLFWRCVSRKMTLLSRLFHSEDNSTLLHIYQSLFGFH